MNKLLEYIKENKDALMDSLNHAISIVRGDYDEDTPILDGLLEKLRES